MDIDAVLSYLRLPEIISKFKIDASRLFLGGFCLGGGMAMAYAAGHPEVTAVISIAGADQSEFFKNYVRDPAFKKTIDDGFAELSASGTVRFDRGALPREIVEAGEIETIDQAPDLKKNAAALARKDVLIIGAWDDEQTTMEQFILPLYRALQNEKAPNARITAFPGDHYFGKSKDELARAVIEWIKSAPERKIKNAPFQ